MTRRKIIAANWKMNFTPSEAANYLQSFLSELSDVDDVEVVLIPPFTALPVLVERSEKSQFIRLGAQNMHWESNGAFTGEISAPMLRALFCKYVILGHSERRTLFGETDEVVHRKVLSAYGSGLRPILCVGESLEEREAGQLEEVLGRQLRVALAGIESRELAELVVAYEPVWAIGTGRTATRDQAQVAHHYLRFVLAQISDKATADRIRIQYGGSVKPDNTEELMRQPDIDGALVGGASLDPRSFAQIIRATERALR
jgi:triosephosphate isomerase (TIM)